MYKMEEEYTFSNDLDGTSRDDNIIKCGQREARPKLITNFCITSKNKQEYAPEVPAIYGIRPVSERDVGNMD